MKYCTKCGTELTDDAAFCSKCGNACNIVESIETKEETLEEMFQIAREAAKNEDHETAAKYYKRINEIDESDWEAFWGSTYHLALSCPIESIKTVADVLCASTENTCELLNKFPESERKSIYEEFYLKVIDGGNIVIDNCYENFKVISENFDAEAGSVLIKISGMFEILSDNLAENGLEELALKSLLEAVGITRKFFDYCTDHRYIHFFEKRIVSLEDKIIKLKSDYERTVSEEFGRDYLEEEQEQQKQETANDEHEEEELETKEFKPKRSAKSIATICSNIFAVSLFIISSIMNFIIASDNYWDFEWWLEESGIWLPYLIIGIGIILSVNFLPNIFKSQSKENEKEPETPEEERKYCRICNAEINEGTLCAKCMESIDDEQLTREERKLRNDNSNNKSGTMTLLSIILFIIGIVFLFSNGFWAAIPWLITAVSLFVFSCRESSDDICENCQRRNSIKKIDEKLIDEKDTYIKEKRTINQTRKDGYVQSFTKKDKWEMDVDVPATQYIYRITYRCNKCGHVTVDYETKTVRK